MAQLKRQAPHNKESNSDMAREKCVLAYSGGMDSTISTVWIQENYNMDVVTLTVDLGAGPEIVGVEERAAQAGAIQSLIWDVRDEFVNEYVFPGLKAGAMYEGVYALSTALGRPLMAKKLVEAAREVGASAVDALMHRGSSLLAAGIIGVEGDFSRGDALRVVGPDGVEIARGLSGYASEDVRKIQGQRSHQVLELLGVGAADPVLHRDDLILTQANDESTQR